MRDENLFGAIAFVAVILFLTSTSFMAHAIREERQEFQRVCKEAGGVTVFDGRSHQCIKPLEEKA